MITDEETINVAEAKKHLSEILSRVAYGKQHILITKWGKPMAHLVPVQENDRHLGDVHGWLDDDPFFDIIEGITKERSKHILRILK